MRRRCRAGRAGGGPGSAGRGGCEVGRVRVGVRAGEDVRAMHRPREREEERAASAVARGEALEVARAGVASLGETVARERRARRVLDVVRVAADARERVGRDRGVGESRGAHQEQVVDGAPERRGRVRMVELGAAERLRGERPARAVARTAGRILGRHDAHAERRERATQVLEARARAHGGTNRARGRARDHVARGCHGEGGGGEGGGAI